MKHPPVLVSKARTTRKKAKLQAGAAAMASLAAFGPTGAQENEADGLSNIAQVTNLSNGSDKLELSDGRIVIVLTEDWALVDGNLVLSGSIAADLGIAPTGGVCAIMAGQSEVIVAGAAALAVAGLTRESSDAVSFSPFPVFSSADNNAIA